MISGFQPSAFQENAFQIGADVAPPVVVETFSGGWFPYQRIRTPKEIRDERIALGILPPDVVEEVLPVIVAVPKKRRKLALEEIIGKPMVAEAQISEIDIEIAVQAFRRRARQRREDDELLLLH